MSFIKTPDRESIVLRPLSASQASNLQDSTVGVQRSVVGPFSANYKLTSLQIEILRRVQSFYTTERIDTLLRSIVNQNGDTSLRVLDWLCTNWSKSNNICCIDESGNLFNIHQGYRLALSYFRRRNFDPFRRRLRCTVQHPAGDVESTVGQLNYLEYCHRHGILKYAAEHAAEIEENMNAATCHSKKRKQEAYANGGIVRRNELSKASVSKVTVHETKSIVSVQ